MAATARKYGMQLETCSETIDLSHLEIEHGACINGKLVTRLVRKKRMEVTGCADRLGMQISLFPEADAGFPQAKGLRGACRCAESIDIGRYDTCSNGCIYCYANK